MTTDVLLYTTNWCPFCRRAKALLKERACDGRSSILRRIRLTGRPWRKRRGEAPCRRSSSMAPLSVAPMSYSRSMSEASSTNSRAQPACHLRRCGLGQPAREPSPVDEYKRRVRWSQPSGKTLLSPQATKQSSSREITTSHRQEST